MKVACFLCLLFLTLSCTEDRISSAEIKATLIGTWNSTSYFITDCDDTINNKGLRKLEDCQVDGCQEYVFFENGDAIYSLTEAGKTKREFPATYTVMGTRLTVCTQHFSDCFVYEVSLDEQTKKDAGIVILSLELTKSETTGCIRTTIYEK